MCVCVCVQSRDIANESCNTRRPPALIKSDSRQNKRHTCSLVDCRNDGSTTLTAQRGIRRLLTHSRAFVERKVVNNVLGSLLTNRSVELQHLAGAQHQHLRGRDAVSRASKEVRVAVTLWGRGRLISLQCTSKRGCDLVVIDNGLESVGDGDDLHTSAESA